MSGRKIYDETGKLYEARRSTYGTRRLYRCQEKESKNLYRGTRKPCLVTGRSFNRKPCIGQAVPQKTYIFRHLKPTESSQNIHSICTQIRRNPCIGQVIRSTFHKYSSRFPCAQTRFTSLRRLHGRTCSSRGSTNIEDYSASEGASIHAHAKHRHTAVVQCV